MSSTRRLKKCPFIKRKKISIPKENTIVLSRIVVVVAVVAV